MNPAPDTHLTPLVTRVVTAVLDDLAGRAPGAPAPSEPAISQTQEVSRTKKGHRILDLSVMVRIHVPSSVNAR